MLDMIKSIIRQKKTFQESADLILDDEALDDSIILSEAIDNEDPLPREVTIIVCDTEDSKKEAPRQKVKIKHHKGDTSEAEKNLSKMLDGSEFALYKYKEFRHAIELYIEEIYGKLHKSLVADMIQDMVKECELEFKSIDLLPDGNIAFIFTIKNVKDTLDYVMDGKNHKPLPEYSPIIKESVDDDDILDKAIDEEEDSEDKAVDNMANEEPAEDDVLDEPLDGPEKDDKPTTAEEDDLLDTKIDDELPTAVGLTGEPAKAGDDDILSTEIDLTSNTMKDILPTPPANAGDAVEDDLLDQRIDAGFGDEGGKEEDDILDTPVDDDRAITESVNKDSMVKKYDLPDMIELEFTGKTHFTRLMFYADEDAYNIADEETCKLLSKVVDPVEPDPHAPASSVKGAKLKDSITKKIAAELNRTLKIYASQDKKDAKRYSDDVVENIKEFGIGSWEGLFIKDKGHIGFSLKCDLDDEHGLGIDVNLKNGHVIIGGADTAVEHADWVEDSEKLETKKVKTESSINFFEAISIGGDEGGKEEDDILDTPVDDTPPDEPKEDNPVTAAVKDKVADMNAAEEPAEEEPMDDVPEEAPADTTSGTPTNKEELFKKLSNLTKNLEDIKGELFRN